jgi:hypothetical protein
VFLLLGPQSFHPCMVEANQARSDVPYLLRSKKGTQGILFSSFILERHGSMVLSPADPRNLPHHLFLFQQLQPGCHLLCVQPHTEHRYQPLATSSGTSQLPDPHPVKQPSFVRRQGPGKTRQAVCLTQLANIFGGPGLSESPFPAIGGQYLPGERGSCASLSKSWFLVMTFLSAQQRVDPSLWSHWPVSCTMVLPKGGSRDEG